MNNSIKTPYTSTELREHCGSSKRPHRSKGYSSRQLRGSRKPAAPGRLTQSTCESPHYTPAVAIDAARKQGSSEPRSGSGQSCDGFGARVTLGAIRPCEGRDRWAFRPAAAIAGLGDKELRPRAHGRRKPRARPLVSAGSAEARANPGSRR